MVKDMLMVFLLSMTPVLELRGAIPLGFALGLDPAVTAVLAIIGNMLPTPFIILFSRRIFLWLRINWPWLGRVIDKIEHRAERKIPTVQKYAIFGLCLFVAIPFPGTGAWTGALISAMLDIRLKRAIPCILLGVLIAAAIVTLISYGVVSGFGI